MQFQKGQQKVPTIRKTTGLCPSRCYFRSIAFAVSEDALCFSHVGDEARETVSMVAATPAYYPPSAASVEPVSRRPRPPSLPDRPADIGGPPQLLPRNHNSSSSSSSVPPVGSSYMAANNGIVVPPSSSSSSSSAASYKGQQHHHNNNNNNTIHNHLHGTVENFPGYGPPSPAQQPQSSFQQQQPHSYHHYQQQQQHPHHHHQQQPANAASSLPPYSGPPSSWGQVNYHTSSPSLVSTASPSVHKSGGQRSHGPVPPPYLLPAAQPPPYLLPAAAAQQPLPVYHPVYSRSPVGRQPHLPPPEAANGPVLPRQSGASPAHSGHRRGPPPAAQNGDYVGDYLSPSLGDHHKRLQNGEDSLRRNVNGYQRQNGGFQRQNGGDYQWQNGSDYPRQNGTVEPARQNGGTDSSRLNGGAESVRLNGSLPDQEGFTFPDQQHRRLNGDYAKQNGLDAGTGEEQYPAMSQQYARNWPPVSQSPADKLHANKVNRFLSSSCRGCGFMKA